MSFFFEKRLCPIIFVEHHSIMKKIFIYIITIIFYSEANAQLLMPSASPKASVTERVGITDITVRYSRPAVAGRDGKIWGGVVHEGFKALNYGNGIPAPWRAGDNENTTIEFSTDVLIEGHPLAAGKYAFYVAYEGKENNAIAIFASNNNGWGSFFYDEKYAVMKVEVSPVKLEQSTERLTYQFINQQDSGAILLLSWEQLAIPVRIATNLQKTVLASIYRELEGEKGFNPQALAQAAGYLMDQNVHMDQALVYASQAASSTPTFAMLLLKGTIMTRLDMGKLAENTLKLAMSKGSAEEVYNYGRLLLSHKNNQGAMEVFNYNYERYPNIFVTNLGLCQGYAAAGNNKAALKYAEAAHKQAVDATTKKVMDDIVAGLKKG
jgi:hypothetical protein